MLKKYLNDTSGNFALSFAVGSTLVLAAVGIAVDYTSITRQSGNLQDIADVAVLAAARSLEDDQVALKRIAKRAVADNNSLGLNITTQLEYDGDEIRVILKTKYDTMLMGAFNQGQVKVHVDAIAPVATTDPLNIALTLDVTGSMAGANIASLKTAATRLVDTMERVRNDKIQISVVPFANYVNVGIPNRNKPWMDVEDDYQIIHPEVCGTHTPVTSKSGCTTSTSTNSYPGHTSYNDGIPTHHPGGTSTSTTETCTDYTYGPPETTCHTPPPTWVRWYGAAGSRANPLHKTAEHGSTPIPGIMQVNAGVPLLPLTNSYSSVKSKISSLVANGETYIPSGLQWGWRTLTTSTPFTEASSNQGPKVINALILMTDGVNTRSVTAPTHDGFDGVASDALSAELCQKIKDDNIIVYTVAYRFPTGSNSSTRNMLKDCATDDEKFYFARNATQLNRAFDQIALSLYSVRLSH